MPAYFDQLDRVRFEGTQSTNPLAFRHYNPDEIVLGIVHGSSLVKLWRWRNAKRMWHLSFSTS